MNEEWYNDRIRAQQNLSWASATASCVTTGHTKSPLQQPQYDVWLQKIVSAHQDRPNAKDRTFSQFLLDLPSLPEQILALLREFCTDPEKYAKSSSLSL
jgi:symplekin